MKYLINFLFVSFSTAQPGLELMILLPQPPTHQDATMFIDF